MHVPCMEGLGLEDCLLNGFMGSLVQFASLLMQSVSLPAEMSKLYKPFLYACLYTCL